MKSKFKFSLLACLALAFSACSTENNPPFVAEMSVTPSEPINLPSEAETGVKASFTVSSNESWGIRVLDDSGVEAEWLELSVYEYTNMSGRIEDITVYVTVEDNTVNQARSATIVITSEKCEKRVTLTQSSAVYYLRTTTVSPVSVGCAGGEARVAVESNTDWTAAIADGATADVTLGTTSGNGTGEIVLTFGANEDIAARKTATLVISADGCDDVTVVLEQERNQPFITIDEEQSNYILGAEGGTARIYFSTNVNWTASIKETTEIADVALTTTSGDSSVEYVEITYGASVTVEDKVVEIEISAEGVNPVSHIFTQKGCVMTLNFAAQPFKEALNEATGNTPKEAKDADYHIGDYTFHIKAEAASFNTITPAEGDPYNVFAISKGYISTPAVSGLRLGKVVITVANSGAKKFSVYSDAELSVLVIGGGEQSVTKEAPATWTLGKDVIEGSANVPSYANKVYYIKVASMTTHITEIKLIYE